MTTFAEEECQKSMEMAYRAECNLDVEEWQRSMRRWSIYRHPIDVQSIEVGDDLYRALVRKVYEFSPRFNGDIAPIRFRGILVVARADHELPWAVPSVERHPCE